MENIIYIKEKRKDVVLRKNHPLLGKTKEELIALLEETLPSMKEEFRKKKEFIDWIMFLEKRGAFMKK